MADNFLRRKTSAASTDGSFAPHHKAEADPAVVGLVSPGARVETVPGREAFEDRLSPCDDLGLVAEPSTKPGISTIDDPRISEGPADDRRIRRVTIRFTGDPARRARNRAAAVALADLEDKDTTLLRYAELHGKPATLLCVSREGEVYTVEGKPAASGEADRLVVLLKGQRTKGAYIPVDDLVAVQAGYGGAQGCADRFADVRSRVVPKVEPIAGFDDLPVEDPYNPPENSPIAAVYLIDHGISGEDPMPGCLFLATDRQPGDGPNGDDIINGYFWAPDRTATTMNVEPLCPETGSFYGADLKRKGGRIADFSPGSMTLRDCVSHTIPDDRGEAYRRIMGVSHYRDDVGAGAGDPAHLPV